MRGWVRDAVLMGCLSAVAACGGTLGTPAGDAATEDTGDAGQAKGDAAARAGRHRARRRRPITRTPPRKRGRTRTPGPLPKPGWTPPSARMDRTGPAAGDVSTASSDAPGTVGPGGGIVVIGDGGVTSNQASSYLVNPAAHDRRRGSVDRAAIAARVDADVRHRHQDVSAHRRRPRVRSRPHRGRLRHAAHRARRSDRRYAVGLRGSGRSLRNDAYDSGRVLVTDLEDGAVRAFDATSGAPLWVSTVVTTSRARRPPRTEGCFTSPVSMRSPRSTRRPEQGVWTTEIGGTLEETPPSPRAVLERQRRLHRNPRPRSAHGVDHLEIHGNLHEQRGRRARGLRWTRLGPVRRRTGRPRRGHGDPRRQLPGRERLDLRRHGGHLIEPRTG